MKKVKEEKEKKQPHSWRDKGLVVHVITYFFALFGSFAAMYSILLFFITFVII